MSARPVVASVHIADVGARTCTPAPAHDPGPGSIPGLRQANLAICAPLRGSGGVLPSPRRVGLIAFWDDDDALGRFESEHRLAGAFDGGWNARLRPLRIHGTWPGLQRTCRAIAPSSTTGPPSSSRWGALRLTQLRRFLRASRPAERAAVSAPGLLWGTALARPPFVATCSLWASSACAVRLRVRPR